MIGKFANGIADDFLSSLYLATTRARADGPAMNTKMWEHPAVQRNLATLAERGVRFVEPGEGYLACGWTGKGRLAEPDAIVTAALALLGGSRSLSGRTVLVTAGPTYEDVDPVRYLGNRSSGRMGFALAAEAARRGAEVVLVAGPTAVTPPAVATLVRVRSAAEMHAAVMAHAPAADCVDHGGRRGRLHAGRRTGGRQAPEDGRAAHPVARADGRHPGRPRALAGRRRPAGARRLRRRDRGRRSRGRARS